MLFFYVINVIISVKLFTQTKRNTNSGLSDVFCMTNLATKIDITRTSYVKKNNVEFEIYIHLWNDYYKVLKVRLPLNDQLQSHI